MGCVRHLPARLRHSATQGFHPDRTPVLLQVYYLNRSQPPLFAAMVDIYSTRCETTPGFKARSLMCIAREYEYWTSSAKGCIIIDAEGKTHLLSRYYANWTRPRPESFKLRV